MLEKSKEFLKKELDSFNLEDLKQLQELIKFHSDLYYNKQTPIISDKEYDDLLKRLEFLEDKFSIDDKVSISVWANLIESTFKKVKHSRPMISLDNTYNEDDLNDFDKRVKRLLRDEIENLEYRFKSRHEEDFFIKKIEKSFCFEIWQCPFILWQEQGDCDM